MSGVKKSVFCADFKNLKMPKKCFSRITGTTRTKNGFVFRVQVFLEMIYHQCMFIIFNLHKKTDIFIPDMTQCQALPNQAYSSVYSWFLTKSFFK
jgi:hypothetical protein